MSRACKYTQHSYLCMKDALLEGFINTLNRYYLKNALLEGSVPHTKAQSGMDAFAAAAKDARMNNLFNQSMHNHTGIIMKEILEIYKGFEGPNQLVDVAGG